MSENTNNQKRNNNRRHNNSGKKNHAHGFKKNNNPNNNSNNNNNKKRNFSKNRRPKSLTPAKILQKYDNLMEQYLNARKKFFDQYGRNSTKNLDKTEKSYEIALKNLRDFEQTLKDWQKEVLAQKVDGYKPDREYSSNHDLKPEGDIVSFTGEFADPHLLPTQKEHKWSNDTEESTGTMEDYEKYKSSQA